VWQDHSRVALSVSRLVESHDAYALVSIGDPIGFASAIAEAIPNFTLGFQGPCLYQSERLVRREIQGPPLFDPAASQASPQ
jgi:hypothetical protein